MIKRIVVIVMLLIFATNVDARKSLGSTKKEIKAKQAERERKAKEKLAKKEKKNKKKQEYTTQKKLQYYHEAMMDMLIPVMEELKNPEINISNKKIYSTINTYFFTLRKKEKIINITDKRYLTCNDAKLIAPFIATYLKACYLTLGGYQNIINTKEGLLRVAPRGVTPVAFTNIMIPKMKKVGVSMCLAIYNPEIKDFEGKYLDDHAKGMLTKLIDPDWKEKGVEQIAVKGKYFRMAIPMYMDKRLDQFHGGKLGDKDDYGKPKQGFKEGDFIGGVVVTLQLK